MPTATPHQTVDVEAIDEAASRIYDVVRRSPLEYSERLSERFGAKVYLKREDQQIVRAYKIRGAYNLMKSLTDAERARGAVTASTGNHAQSVALAAARLGIETSIYVPSGTPPQKVNRIRFFGGETAKVHLVGKTFDDSLIAALAYAQESGRVFVHPFDDARVVAGQGTIGKEIFEQLPGVDAVVAPIGGGGLIGGIGTYLKAKLPALELIGVESEGAPAMHRSLAHGERFELDHIDKFVDGAAVKAVGRLNFSLAQSLVSDVVLVADGQVCTSMIELYQNEGIVTEPAGALSVAALGQLAGRLSGKTVVLIISGGNNDLLRYPEILEKSLAYEGLKHYLLVEFEQKPGQLREFLDHALGETDDITRFEYIKKTNKDRGAALVGVEVARRSDFARLEDRLQHRGINYTLLKPGDSLYAYMV